MIAIAYEGFRVFILESREMIPSVNNIENVTDVLVIIKFNIS